MHASPTAELEPEHNRKRCLGYEISAFRTVGKGAGTVVRTQDGRGLAGNLEVVQPDGRRQGGLGHADFEPLTALSDSYS